MAFESPDAPSGCSGFSEVGDCVPALADMVVVLWCVAAVGDGWVRQVIQEEGEGEGEWNAVSSE